jgi:signal transduction histidine kinase
VSDGHGVLDVSPVVGLAAYRIVQEALSNVLRHAHARTVTVTLARQGTTLEVDVTDDGIGPGAAPTGSGSSGGFGLVGMAERAAVLGGRVDHGPAPDGGFRVRAVLPLSEAPGVGP